MLQSDLSMKDHVARTVSRCFRQLRLLIGCIKYPPFEATKAEVAAFVTSVTSARFLSLDLGFLAFVWVSRYFFYKICNNLGFFTILIIFHHFSVRRLTALLTSADHN